MRLMADDKFCVTQNVNVKVKSLTLIDMSAMPTKCKKILFLFLKAVNVELRAFTFVSLQCAIIC